MTFYIQIWRVEQLHIALMHIAKPRVELLGRYEGCQVLPWQ